MARRIEISEDDLMWCERRIEGILTIVGSFADTDNKPEMEIIHDELLNVTENLRKVITTADVKSYMD